MKKVMLLSLLLGTGCLFSCSKQEAASGNGQAGKTRSTNRELPNYNQATGIKHYVKYGTPTESPSNPGYYTCMGNSSSLCAWGIASESMNEVKFTTGTSTAASTVLRMEFLNTPAYPSSPFMIVAAPARYLPANVISFYGFTSGMILPGAYPITYTATYPLGYVTLSIAP
jgi:hypothetical protein